MLINFTVKNWRSIKDEASITMQATREQQHGERLIKSNKFGFRILPNAIVFGPNASGKSNFVKAIEFLKDFVIFWDERFLNRNLTPNKLEIEQGYASSEFTIEMLLDGFIYEYYICCSSKEVREERLSKSNTSSEYMLFHRINQDFEFNESQISADDLYRLKVISQGTDRTRPLLNNAHEQKLDTFDTVYNWFKYSLQIIHPTSIFSRLSIFTSDEIVNLYNAWLPHLDTGIVRVEIEETTADKIGLSEENISEISDILFKAALDKGVSASLGSKGDFGLVKIQPDGTTEIFRLITIHLNNNGDEVRFKMSEESDGTKRVLELIPAFCRDRGVSKTFIIDEIDRSLHSGLTKSLFQSFHSRCNEDNQDQIVATTHDLQLMTQSLFRRDEMWFFERDHRSSTLTSFADFIDTKKDKDIRKSYLDGRMGGLPNLRFDQIDLDACGG